MNPANTGCAHLKGYLVDPTALVGVRLPAAAAPSPGLEATTRRPGGLGYHYWVTPADLRSRLKTLPYQAVSIKSRFLQHH
jgi:hypothetical protein